jgi:hypothetical protein
MSEGELETHGKCAKTRRLYPAWRNIRAVALFKGVFRNMGYWKQQANLSVKIVTGHETFFDFQRLYL